MKNILTLLLILSMLLTFTACNNNDLQTTLVPTENITVENTATSTHNITENTTNGDTAESTESPTTTPTPIPTTTSHATEALTSRRPTTEVTSTENETLSKTQIESIVNQHIGLWYLKGYADVCIDVKKSSDYTDVLIIETHNFALPSEPYEGSPAIEAYTVYPQKNALEGAHWGGLMEILYSNANNYQWSTETHKLKFCGDSIYIANCEFVKDPGTIDMYYDVCWPEALGTWYLKDSPSSIIKITKESDGSIDSGASFRIETESFNIENLSSNGYGFVGIRLANIQQSWDEFGISVKNDVLTIANNNGTRTFYKYITEPQPVRVSGVQTNTTTLNLNIGDMQQLTATVFPSNADNQNVTWSSNNNSIAQVSTTGKITANGEGTAIITVTTKDGGFTATCTVTVTEPPTTEPPVTEPPISSGDRIITDSESISNTTITGDVYITSTGVATFSNVTVNGNVYCYGKLIVSGGSANNLYAYYWDLGGITSWCDAWDGTHGLVKGAFSTCGSVIIKDNALDYAFGKWGKQ